MADERVRRLERRWRETGAEEDRTRLFEERRRLGLSLKVVLHCMAMQGPDDHLYGTAGMVHRDLERSTAIPLRFHSCGDHLVGSALERFIEECRNADVVLLDAWTHPRDEGWVHRPVVPDPEQAMAIVACRLATEAPRARLLAEMMEGVTKVAVHQYAQPFAHWDSSEVIAALLETFEESGSSA